MKKLLAATVLATTLPLSGLTLADSDVGCGFGTMVFDGSEGKVPKILAATTNGLLATKLLVLRLVLWVVMVRVKLLLQKNSPCLSMET